MQQTSSLATVDLSSIDLVDRTYHFNPLREIIPDSALLTSIRKYGILHPPVLRRRKNTWIIVTGRKRIAAARQLGFNSIICLLLPAETEEQYIYRLLVEESAYCNGLSLIEQAGLLDALLEEISIAGILPILEKLGHKPQEHVLNEIRSLLSLDQSALVAVHLDKIPFKAALKLRRLSVDNQRVLVNIITALNLGGSKQNKLIDYATELIIRTDTPLNKLMAEFITDGDEDRFDNIPQKTNTMMRWLHRQCFPKMTEAEDKFRKEVAGLQLPGHVHLEHSLSFEEESVTLSLRLTDMKTLRQVLPEILRITGDLKKQ